MVTNSRKVQCKAMYPSYYYNKPRSRFCNGGGERQNCIPYFTSWDCNNVSLDWYYYYNWDIICFYISIKPKSYCNGTTTTIATTAAAAEDVMKMLAQNVTGHYIQEEQPDNF